jgi:RNase adaptor protein for sRNA GlmZ degradation
LNAYIEYNKCMQYTIRNIPDYLDATLRDVARREDKSLNEVAVAALVRGAGLAERERVKRDLSDIAGTWQEDPAFDSAIQEQRKIDEAIWR